MKNAYTLAIVWTAFVALALGAGAALAATYAIDWHTIDGGGMTSIGGTYELTSTIGQPDARNHPDAMTGGDYSLTSGFWVIPQCPAVPGDYDTDCDVDQGDHSLFETCASGPEVPHEVDCNSRDFDDDGDVDEVDFGVFQRCYSGENVPGDPNCAD